MVSNMDWDQLGGSSFLGCVFSCACSCVSEAGMVFCSMWVPILQKASSDLFTWLLGRGLSRRPKATFSLEAHSWHSFTSTLLCWSKVVLWPVQIEVVSAQLP